MPHHLVGVAEIARLLGVSRQRVDQLVSSYPDFPAPVAELAAGRIWSRADIEGWTARHPERKPGRSEGRQIMFDRLTDRARTVFVLAQEEARRLGHNYVGCEHLVLGLLGEEQGVARRALSGLGLDLASARTALGRLLGPGTLDATDVSLPFTTRVRDALDQAQEVALELGHNYIGTEHILLGVLREGENVGCRLLVEAGIDLSVLRLKILEVMGYPQPGRAGGDLVPRGALQQLTAQLSSIDARLQSLERRLP